MDQDIEIINNQTRLEKLKHFLKNNLKLINIILITIIFVLIGFF